MRCPECNQVIKLSRVCFKCKKGIAKYHKWKQVQSEDWSFTLEHWDCNAPDTYGKKYAKEKKK